MKYEVSTFVFDRLPEVKFGIIIGEGLKNSNTTEEDSRILSEAEESLKEKINPSEIKTHAGVAIYRDALRAVEINPNKYMNSVEAMSKRVVKGGALPRINALVDRVNAISLKYIISLGGHDLKDIDDDLMVRLSEEGDRYLPFGQETFESVPAGELVFTSGNTVQTRQWLWRQSELGKVTLDSSRIFFQLVGFDEKLDEAMDEVEALVKERFGGETRRYMVSKDQTEITF
jgi:DNA/RNA-binding domain of Phe-tRNA-synthetase-like protein